MLSINSESARPNSGEVWWFPVDAHPGSRDRKDKRWVKVLIPQVQDKYLFAARPELRIPGAAMMTYVSDPRPTAVICRVEGHFS